MSGEDRTWLALPAPVASVWRGSAIEDGATGILADSVAQDGERWPRGANRHCRHCVLGDGGFLSAVGCERISLGFLKYQAKVGEDWEHGGVSGRADIEAMIPLDLLGMRPFRFWIRNTTSQSQVDKTEVGSTLCWL